MGLKICFVQKSTDEKTDVKEGEVKKVLSKVREQYY